MTRKAQDLENQIREIRKQLNDQLACLEFRTESKQSLLNELKDFFKKRGEVEFEYAKNLERLCERFERSTKQRNIKHEVRSTFNLWSTLLAETRRMARDRATLAEVLAAEMGARLDIMTKDVAFISRKCKDLYTDVHENLMKELKDLNEQSKLYQYSCHHCMEAHTKLVKSREKVEGVKNSAVRKRKAEEKEQERLRQFNELKHRQMKSRNDYLLKIASSNARALHYYSVDVMSVVEFMDTDYHDSFKRLAQAYSDAEQGSCQSIMKATSSFVDQAQTLNFENDMHYFLSEFASIFTQPPEFSYVSFGDDDVAEYKVNTKDVFLKAQEIVKNLTEEIKTLEIQADEDTKTIEHMSRVNLRKYKVQTVDDALAVLEEAGEPLPPEPASKASSLDRGSLALTTRAVQALHSSQKGKEDTLTFTLGVFQRKLARAAQLNISSAKLNIVDKSLSEQKVPPISVGGDYRVPKLFGGDCLEYILATGSSIPLILLSCCQAIEKEGLKTEGLFRVPGPAQQIEDLKKGFEEGRDPLAYSAVKKIEITAVASVLKLYFRELANPLFPCDKYYAFIKCSRKEDPQERLDAIRDTIRELHPAICTVMRYLFRFLNNVSQHTTETKMNSANVALVFGPTLTRAPDDADPRLLHNDVPAINVLIQLCIEHHNYIFGEESEEDGLSSPPPPPEEPPVSVLGTSLDGYPPYLPDEEPESPEIIETVLDDVIEMPIPADNEVEEVPEPDAVESPEETHLTTQEQPVDESPPVIAVELPVAEPPIEEHPIEEPPAGELPTEEELHPAEPPKKESPIEVVKEQPTGEEPTGEEPTVEEPNPDDKLVPDTQTFHSQVSTSSISGYLVEALHDIETSIELMKERPKSSTPVVVKEESDSGDSDSDTEEVLTICARALYDYTARNEKELSFEKGSMLDVIEKTPDGNWWDGFHQGRRGYIPVSYVEIAELSAAPRGPLVPVPPLRKSSMQKEGEEDGDTPSPKPSISADAIIEEEELKHPEVKSIDAVVVKTTGDSTPKDEGMSPKQPPEESPKRKMDVPIKSGAVSKLTQQFQQPPPAASLPQQRVLVGPHTHRRYPSADMTKGKEESASRSFQDRSGSGGSKVQMKPPLHTPPPIKPKPDKEPPVGNVSPFPLMSHDTHVSASPLQKAHLQGQFKKPAPPKKGGVFRSSGKKTPEKPPLPNKPAPPPTKPAAPPKPPQLQAELAAATALRRKQDGEAS